MTKLKPTKAWAEIDSQKNLVMGRIGLKAYRFKKDIMAEGFAEDEITQVLITPLPKRRKL